MDGQDSGVPVDAVRAGPGQFRLAAERVEIDLLFATGGQTFRVISRPVDIGSGRYLVTVAVVAGPGAGSQLTVQVQVGSRLNRGRP
ncbi:hypothetical protein E0H75_13215 [Kribbella capetownensis]|uniref:Uncharacterized protein n=1 Tax=Kribbella capetownensis TaxID=1572659 RepID=A0A4R0JXW4_9ACTN|nr:hypothetical protein [Kribbella capetownensis]TCC51094.1 hypothetical protein E0H75_13215 [Kribbella capetownensis]